MTEQLSNRIRTTLNGGINNSTTTLVVASGTGWPASGNFRIRIDDEIILVGARSGTTFSSMTRAAEAVDGSTVAASHLDGAEVRLVLTKAAVEQRITEISDVEAAAAVSTHAGLADPHTGYMLESMIDAKGDLIAGSADNTPAKVTVGTNGKVLTADSGATAGVSWQTPTASGGAVDLQTGFALNEFHWPPPYVGELDAANQWWHKVGTPSTAPTWVAAGDGSTGKQYGGPIKVVAAAGGDGLKDTWTYANEPRVISGQTISVLCAIWSVGGISVTAKMVNSDATHTDASPVTAAAWTVVAIEGHVLAGTSCSFQVTAGGAGTFYVVPLGARIGSFAMSLPPRPVVYQTIDNPPTIKTLTALTDENTWTDIDVTSVTSTLAIRLFARANSSESSAQYRLYVRRNGSSEAAGNNNMILLTDVNTQFVINDFQIVLDDQQIFEYNDDRFSGSGTLDFGEMYAVAYELWA